MPELRKDPVIGRWVIIATERAKRPTDFKPAPDAQELSPCPFCQGNESMTPPEVFAVRENGSRPNGPGWQARVVSNISPLLRIEGDLGRRGRGMYDTMQGIGAHEVILESPEHIRSMASLDVPQIAKVLTCYAQRLHDLEKDPRFKYGLIFKNHGEVAGEGNIHHSRSQLIAMAVTPNRIKEKLVGAQRYFEYRERCLFCDMIRQELETGTRIIAESNGAVAFCPYASQFPFEIWVFPKRHNPDFGHITEEEKKELAEVMKISFQKLDVALKDPPYNFILNTAPFRRPKAGYWRTIDDDFHWHMEIMPRLTQVAGFEWGAGVFINPTSPEQAAAFLKEAPVGTT